MLHKISEIEQQEIIKGFKGRFIHGDFMTLVYWEVEKGASLPEHHHIHEQITQLVEGSFEMTIEGETMLLEPGMLVRISPNKKHSGKALTNCKITDVFSPARLDYK